MQKWKNWELVNHFAVLIRGRKNMNLYTPLRTIDSGYIGNPEKWSQYFKCLAEMLVFEGDAKDALVAATKVAGLKKHEINLSEAEARFKMLFPKSYKDFVIAGGIEFINKLYTNVMCDGEIKAFYQLRNINYFKNIAPNIYHPYFDSGLNDLDITDDDYYRYDSYEYDDEDSTKADCPFIKKSNMNFLTIGFWDTDAYGFVTNEVTKDGEYETWSFSPDNPGANRYRSFAEFFIFDRVRFLKYIKDEVEGNELFDDKSTSLILDVKILREQWKPK
ncbi:hypothetical protein FK216_05855 [Moraxellaceae bacterium AER2_44_116]|nr:hypothetical protein [Moraxellaceae bacterium]TQC98382.1 hypothetical protein FK216_05855 [Moraxellaceae bacterium AER2_44_116]